MTFHCLSLTFHFSPLFLDLSLPFVQDASKLLGRFKDSAARIEATATLFPRIVDEVNINGLL